MPLGVSLALEAIVDVVVEWRKNSARFVAVDQRKRPVIVDRDPPWADTNDGSCDFPSAFSHNSSQGCVVTDQKSYVGRVSVRGRHLRVRKWHEASHSTLQEKDLVGLVGVWLRQDL